MARLTLAEQERALRNSGLSPDPSHWKGSDWAKAEEVLKNEQLKKDYPQHPEVWKELPCLP